MITQVSKPGVEKAFGGGYAADLLHELQRPLRGIYWHDHFWGQATEDPRLATAKTNGTSASVAADNAARGHLLLTTGTDNDGYAGQGVGLNWQGNFCPSTSLYSQKVALRDALITECRFKIDIITSVKFEFGWTDSVADAGAALVRATPTATADNAAIFLWDTAENANLELFTVNAAGTPVSTALSTPAAVWAAATYLILRVALIYNGTDMDAFFWTGTDASDMTFRGTKSGACLGSVGLTPWVFAQARVGSASKVASVDYMWAYGPTN